MVLFPSGHPCGGMRTHSTSLVQNSKPYSSWRPAGSRVRNGSRSFLKAAHVRKGPGKVLSLGQKPLECKMGGWSYGTWPCCHHSLPVSSAVCQPPCQNRGSCSRPQLCVCRSGFRGARCEEVIPEEEFDPQNARPVPRRSVEGAPSPHRSSEARGSLVTRIQPLAPPLLPAR